MKDCEHNIADDGEGNLHCGRCGDDWDPQTGEYTPNVLRQRPMTVVGMTVTQVLCPQCNKQTPVVDPWSLPRTCDHCDKSLPGLASLLSSNTALRPEGLAR